MSSIQMCVLIIGKDDGREWYLRAVHKTPDGWSFTWECFHRHKVVKAKTFAEGIEGLDV